MHPEERLARDMGVVLDCPECGKKLLSTRGHAMAWKDDRPVVWVDTTGFKIHEHQPKVHS